MLVAPLDDEAPRHSVRAGSTKRNQDSLNGWSPTYPVINLFTKLPRQKTVKDDLTCTWNTPQVYNLMSES